jgi:sulfide dehydrogenase [flavocytochrome c] flavoprotein subunit
MTNFTRRNFMKGAMAGSALAMAGFGAQAGSRGDKHKHVVIIGGGFGGATAAKYLKKFDPNVQVTLIEPNKNYVTCPGSNWVIGGLRDIASITHSYSNLSSKYGIKLVHDWVVDIDAANQKVKLRDGSAIHYDRLIVSPGIRFLYDGMIEGYSKAVSEEIAPHAWQAGPQTVLLRKQLEAMPDGGTFIVVPPPNPFRCPPGPGERISMVANYFKQHKPKSKIIALDGKGKFSKQGLFKQGWAEMYEGMIDYRHNTVVEGLDGRTVMTEVEDFKADVLNVIPAQKAGWIAERAGLTDRSGWCPVDHLTWESKVHKNIHVIGDAAIQAPLPKSGYAANSEAKVCAASVVALLNGVEPTAPSWVNTCYSLVGPEYGISVAMVYDLKDGKVSKVEGSGGLTPKDANRAVEAVYAGSWYDNVVDDMFG